jgi:hypothetical protein
MYAGVQDAHDRRARAGDAQSATEFLDPLCLLDRRHISEHAGYFVRPAKLGQVVEGVKAISELVCARTQEHDRPVLETEVVSAGEQSVPLGELAEPFLLVPIVAA